MPFASLGRRVIAFTIDSVLCAIVTAGIAYAFTDFGRATRNYVAAVGNREARQEIVKQRHEFLKQRNTVRNFAVLLLVASSAVLEASFLQATLGKLICGIKVASYDGSRISFGSSLFRNGLKPIVGFLSLLWQVVRQRLPMQHDEWTNTYVIPRWWSYETAMLAPAHDRDFETHSERQ